MQKINNNLELILKYFPDLTPLQVEQFTKLYDLYTDWNSKINVISRKDIEELYSRHVLHSLGIAKVIQFQPGTTILDVGTGGGFPGIPLAILFPETQFYLIDIIAKKIKVVQEFDFIVSRAVTNMPDFVKWTKDKTKKNSIHELKNGILYLKGGDLTEELAAYKTVQLYNLPDFFEEDFFETKKVVYLPLKYKS